MIIGPSLGIAKYSVASQGNSTEHPSIADFGEVPLESARSSLVGNSTSKVHFDESQTPQISQSQSKKKKK